MNKPFRIVFTAGIAFAAGLLPVELTTLRVQRDAVEVERQRMQAYEEAALSRAESVSDDVADAFMAGYGARWVGAA